MENIFQQKRWKIFSDKNDGKYIPVENVFRRADEFSLSQKINFERGSTSQTVGRRRGGGFETKVIKYKIQWRDLTGGSPLKCGILFTLYACGHSI